MAHNNPLLPVNPVSSLYTVEKNSLGTCDQDMKSCPTPAVEFSKIQNGFVTAGSLFQKTSAEFVPHMFDRVQVQQQARPWKTSDVLLIFVFLDELGRGRLAMFC